MKTDNLFFNLNYIQTLFPSEIIDITKGEILFKEGEINDFVFFIKSGKLKVSKTENVIGFTREKEFIGITSCLCDGDHFYFTAVACENSSLLKIDKTFFKKALIENPEFGKTMIEILCRRIKITDNKTKSFTQLTTSERIINEILNNVLFENDLRKIYLSIDDLTELTGVSSIQVLTTIKDLTAKNLIKMKDEKITITHLEKLKALLTPNHPN